MTEEIELDVEDVILEKVPASEYTSRKYDNHQIGRASCRERVYTKV